MNFLDQAKSLFQSKVLNKSSSSVLGIDMGASSIKLVQLRNEQGTAVLETYGDIALGPAGNTEVGQATNLPPEKLAPALKDLISGCGATATSCGVSVPFSASLIKLIEVPALEMDQLKTVIPIEARKYIPVPLNEVQFDYFIVPETEQKLFMGARSMDEASATELKTRMVLLVAMPNEIVRKYVKTFNLAGLNPSFYEIEVFSTIRSTISRSLAPVAIVDLGAATSKLYLVELGIILASHVVPIGSQDITRSLASSTHVSLEKAEEIKRQAGILSGVQSQDAVRVSHAATLTMEQILTEVRRVLLGFQRKYNKVISKVILTGAGSSLKGLPEFAKQQLEIEVEIANPFSRVQTPAFAESVLKEAGPIFTSAIGIALRKLSENQ